jgi:hypothetical protein
MRPSRTAVLLGIGVATGATYAALAAKPSPTPPTTVERTTVFARVSADGSLAGGTGASSSSRASAGDYRVTFGRSIKRCALTATMIAPNSSSYESIGGIEAVPASDKTARVVTYNKASGPVSNDFYLVVNCKAAAKTTPNGSTEGTGGADGGGDTPAEGVSSVHWARVDSDGSLGTNSGVASSSRAAVGEYRVTFDDPIDQCALTATMIAPGSNAYETVGGVQAVAIGTRVARVVTYNQASGPASNDFYLVANC